MYGNGCCHCVLMLLDVSTIIKLSMIKYTNSNDISMILSNILLNGLTNPKYAKYATCNENRNMTASGPSCCPQIIVKAVNTYFLIKLTDRNDLNMFGPQYGHSLYNINIYNQLTCCSFRMWYH